MNSEIYKRNSIIVFNLFLLRTVENHKYFLNFIYIYVNIIIIRETIIIINLCMIRIFLKKIKIANYVLLINICRGKNI